MKLHVGAGGAYIHGWINVDIFSNIRADVYSNALALPYDRCTFDLIYASHVLEHFNRHLIQAALGHWRDLLKPGGILRLSVPDFKAVCNRYSTTGNLKELLGLLYGRQDSFLNVHQVAFDKETLDEALCAVGFKTVRLWDWRSTEHTSYDDYSQAYLPHMDKDNGMHMSLNIEAVK